MTRDEIIRMALEAGFENPMPLKSGGSVVLPWPIFERFHALEVAAERRKHQADIERWKEAAVTAEKWRGLALSRDPGAAGATVQAIQQEAAAAEREACAPVMAAAQNLMDWIEISHRPPVRDQFETGRMVRVRLHALADLYESIRASGQQ